MAFSLTASSFAFAPAAPLVQQRAAVQHSAVQMAIENMPGKYGTGEVFDPLGLSNKFDIKWLREAEIKHGRICMLATLGYVSVDLGLKLPNHDWSSFEAHDKSLGPFGGAMGQILLFLSLLEIFTAVPATNYMMNGGDREPGDFGFDPLGYLDGVSPEAKLDMQTKELKNGRLAMLAISGMVTQAGIGHTAFPYV